jgi:hypothetical protein
MRIGYSKAWGVALVVLSCALLALLTLNGTWARRDITLYGPALAALSCLISGIGYLTRTYFEVGPDRITLFAVLGPLKREFPFRSRADLRVDGGRLFVGSRKLPIRRGQANAADWDELAASLSQARC